MSEPTLETIGDYNELKGEKKQIVWGVIIAGILIGSVYVLVNNIYGDAKDKIKVQETIKTIPVK